MNELIEMSAREVVSQLRCRNITPVDLIDAAAARIGEVDVTVNALPTLCFDRARDCASRRLANGRDLADSTLGGIPLVIKDLTDVSGVRTTYGSTIFRDHVPTSSNIVVERLAVEGGIVIAKSNTPEWGAGGNTFNDVFGATRNPWNIALSCGGSSGGSAVALATGMTWLATGSDLGGSLRIPASFCNVVGFRTSPGRIAHGPGAEPFSPLWIDGPMARDVFDLALMMDAICGFDPRDPLSFESCGESFVDAAETKSLPTVIGYSENLALTPVDKEIAAICQSAVVSLEGLGVRVSLTELDLSEAHSCFRTLRAASFATAFADIVGDHRDALKPEVISNIEEGIALSAGDIARAERQRAQIHQKVAGFFETHDLLITPCVAVPPFPVEQRYVTKINGQAMETYFGWLSLTYAITLTGCPALSLPCGFTQSGLPVGLQLVGRPRGETRLLAHAAAMEDHFGLPKAVINPRSASSPGSDLEQSERPAPGLTLLC